MIATTFFSLIGLIAGENVTSRDDKEEHSGDKQIDELYEKNIRYNNTDWITLQSRQRWKN